MSDGLIVSVQKELGGLIVAGVTGINRVEHVAGVFDEDTARIVVSTANVIHMAFLGAANPERLAGGQSVIYASYGAYVATTGKDRHFQAVNTLEAVATVLSQVDTGDTSDLQTPFSEGVMLGEMETLYDKQAGKRGMALYGLSFSVKLIIGNASLADDLDILDPDDFPTITGIEGEDIVTDPLNPPEGSVVDAEP